MISTTCESASDETEEEMATATPKGLKRSRFSVMAGVLLLASALRAESGETVRSEKPIDFYYLGEQAEILVPFGNVQVCMVAYVGTHAGLVIERVVSEGKDIKPLTIKGGVLDGRWDLMLQKPGESFRYQVKLGALESVTLGTPFDGKSFPVAANPPPRSVEIYYRVRCANGKLSELYVTRGVRLDFERGKLTTGVALEPRENGDASRKDASGTAKGGNNGQRPR